MAFDWRSDRTAGFFLDGRFIVCNIREKRRDLLKRLMPWVLLVIHDVPDSTKTGVAKCLDIVNDTDLDALGYALRVLKDNRLIERDNHGWRTTPRGSEAVALLRSNGRGEEGSQRSAVPHDDAPRALLGGARKDG